MLFILNHSIIEFFQIIFVCNQIAVICVHSFSLNSEPGLGGGPQMYNVILLLPNNSGESVFETKTGNVGFVGGLVTMP